MYTQIMETLLSVPMSHFTTFLKIHLVLGKEVRQKVIPSAKDLYRAYFKAQDALKRETLYFIELVINFSSRL